MGIVVKDISDVVTSLKVMQIKAKRKMDKRSHKTMPEETEERWRVEDVEVLREPVEQVEAATASEVSVPKTEKIENQDGITLEKAIIWAEILGEPLSKKRRRKRMEQRYGNQSYVNRG